METTTTSSLGKTEITIGGKLRKFVWGKVAVEIYVNLSKGSEVKTGSLISILYAGLYMGCYVKEQRPDFTFADVCEWYDTISDETIAQINAAIESSHVFKSSQKTPEVKPIQKANKTKKK